MSLSKHETFFIIYLTKNSSVVKHLGTALTKKMISMPDYLRQCYFDIYFMRSITSNTYLCLVSYNIEKESIPLCNAMCIRKFLALANTLVQPGSVQGYTFPSSCTSRRWFFRFRMLLNVLLHIEQYAVFVRGVCCFRCSDQS